MFRNRFLIVARCFSSDLEKYFEYQGQDYICSRPDDNGMHSCSNLPPLKFGECIFDILFTGFPIFFPSAPTLFFIRFPSRTSSRFRSTLASRGFGIAVTRISGKICPRDRSKRTSHISMEIASVDGFDALCDC